MSSHLFPRKIPLTLSSACTTSGPPSGNHTAVADLLRIVHPDLQELGLQMRVSKFMASSRYECKDLPFAEDVLASASCTCSERYPASALAISIGQLHVSLQKQGRCEGTFLSFVIAPDTAPKLLLLFLYCNLRSYRISCVVPFLLLGSLCSTLLGLILFHGVGNPAGSFDNCRRVFSFVFSVTFCPYKGAFSLHLLS